MGVDIVYSYLDKVMLLLTQSFGDIDIGGIESTISSYLLVKRSCKSSAKQTN